MNNFAETAVAITSFAFTSGASYVIGFGAGGYVRTKVGYAKRYNVNRTETSILAAITSGALLSHTFPRPLRTHIKFASGFFFAGYITSRS